MYKKFLGYEHINTGSKEQVVIYPPYLKQGIEYARQQKIDAITISRLKDMSGFAGNIELNFAPLADFPELEELDIHDNYRSELSAMVNIEALYQLNHLRRLIVRLDLPLDFSKLHSIDWLQYKHSSNFKNLGLIKQLKRLWVLNYQAADLSEIKQLENLDELYLIQPTVASLAGIQEIKSLSKLIIYQAHDLADINHLSQLQNLNLLKLIKCDKITRFTCLIPALEELMIDNITNVDFLNYVPNLKILTFDKLGEDLMQAVLSSDLKVVNFPKSKIDELDS